ncbi:hypothetical protein NPA07_00045 [Mycoplasmopsis caviae]|uniref:Uncharacterized protein n=1 Tax=Mycoplasmopsis caviae TaxID=55603 RepID=A0A3P8KBI7_9BACT|nr:hypothetical protein [Mycoplasmopsis caviae]UUD35261.1 hypothetical protein NPA07_00045 [Mycoplasmopsis caviae]VDR41954.1 Uncharacterised protein [Mycoplasmopsis caviae]
MIFLKKELSNEEIKKLRNQIWKLDKSTNFEKKARNSFLSNPVLIQKTDECALDFDSLKFDFL